VKYTIEQMRKRVVTGDGTNSNVNAADSDATVAGSAAIQLNVAMLRLGERMQPAIGVCVVRSLLIKIRVLTVGVALF
jgi:hypothetical protein